MKKYLLGVIAIVLAIGFSAYNVPPVEIIYKYNTTDQSVGARQTASNYLKVTSLTCSGSGDECAVRLNEDFGSTPNFSGGRVTVNATTGMPNGGTAFLSNNQKAN